MAPKKSAISGQSPALKLTVEKGPLSGQTFEFGSESRIQIGRVVRGNTLSIKDGGISSKHLVIQVESDKWTLTDLMSSNGTFLNGTQLEPSESTVLSSGDVIKIGEMTSMRVTLFEAGGMMSNVRRNVRRGARNRGGGELGVIDEEDSKLGLEGQNGNNLGAVGKLGIADLGLVVENGNDLGVGGTNGLNVGLVNESGKKVRGRRARGSKKAVDSKNDAQVVEDVLITSAMNVKKEGILEEVLAVEPDDNKEKTQNVVGVEGKRGRRNASVKITRSPRKDGDLNKTEGDELGRRGVVEEQRVSVRMTRSSRKEEAFIDLSVIEGKKKRKGARGKTNLLTEIPLEEERSEELNLEHDMAEEEKRETIVGDNEPLEEGRNTGREDTAGVASTSGVKDGVDEIQKGALLRDLETMTLGEWFDFLEVFLPKQIIDSTEELISEMRQKAERVHEFKLQQKNAK